MSAPESINQLVGRFTEERDSPSNVIRPLATSIPNTTWLNRRKVVFAKSGAMVCKTPGISFMGFSGWLVLR